MASLADAVQKFFSAHPEAIGELRAFPEWPGKGDLEDGADYIDKLIQITNQIYDNETLDSGNSFRAQFFDGIFGALDIIESRINANSQDRSWPDYGGGIWWK